VVQRTLIPQFSIRWLLALTTGCAVVFSIFALAWREYLTEFENGCWASAITIAILSVVGVLLIHALAFGAVWAIAEVAALASRRPSKVGQSPFRPDHGSTRHAGRLPDEPATPIISE